MALLADEALLKLRGCSAGSVAAAGTGGRGFEQQLLPLNVQAAAASGVGGEERGRVQSEVMDISDLQQLRRAARREAQSTMLIFPRFRGEGSASTTACKAWTQGGAG